MKELSDLFWSYVALSFGVIMTLSFVVLAFARPQHDITGLLLSVVGFTLSVFLIVIGVIEIKKAKKVKAE